MEKTFKEKVQDMSAKQIIMAMVEGLKNPLVKVDMTTFGKIENGVCFGCAATNTIFYINDRKISEMMFYGKRYRCKLLHVEHVFLDRFEGAIDALRRGNIDGYNYFAQHNDIPLIDKIEGLYLPYLDNNYTQDELEAYVQLANAQESSNTTTADKN